jgi:1,4-dihydroxy-2-naphthoate polyprenyltransferase
MNKLIIWLKELRAPFLTATIVPIIAGAVVAWHQTGLFSWPLFWLTLIGGCFIHLGTNIANDYYDHTSRNDWVNQTPTPFSGGSRFIQQGLISPKHILTASLICFLIGSIIGLYLNHVRAGNIVLWLGISGAGLGFFYTASPIRLSYRGWGLGELAVGIGFGPLMVLGAYYAQAQQINKLPLVVSLPIALWIALVVYINEFPDYEADKAVSKRTIPVMLGKKLASRFYLLFVLLPYLIIFLGIAFRILPIWTALVYITVPLAIIAIRIAWIHYDNIPKLLPANALTILLHLIFGLLLTAGFIIDKLLRVGQ